jgi:cell division septation protein DedD
LREKLNEPEGGGPKQGPSPWIGIILAVLVIGGGIALFAAMRSGEAKQKAAAEEKARAAAAAAVADSIAAVAHADSVRAVADSVAALAAKSGKTAKTTAGAATPKPSQVAAARPATTAPGTPKAAAPPAAAAVPSAPKVVEKGPFALDVGTYLVEDRANSEQARLAAATGLTGKVVTKNEDGGDVYHVFLGSFPSRAAAEKKAESLVAKGLVNQARPVSLAP